MHLVITIYNIYTQHDVIVTGNTLAHETGSNTSSGNAGYTAHRLTKL